MQLYGGFASSTVHALLNRELASWYSVFDCDVELPNRVAEDSTCSILDNIISRGKPTLCSPYVEQVLADRLGLTQENNTGGSIRFKLAEPADAKMRSLIRRALVCIEPRIQNSEVQLSSCESDKEREFLQRILTDAIGAHAPQLLESQRDRKSVV